MTYLRQLGWEEMEVFFYILQNSYFTSQTHKQHKIMQRHLCPKLDSGWLRRHTDLPNFSIWLWTNSKGVPFPPIPSYPPPNPPCQQPTAVFALQVFFLNANSEDGTFCTSSEFDVCIKVLSPNIMSWLGLKLLLVIWIKLDIPSARIPPSPKSILFKTTPGRTCKCPPHSLLSLFPALKNNS